MSLQNPNNKMSKSAVNPRSRILITAPEHEIRERLRTAVTDSINTVTYEPEARPGVANLLELWSQCDPSGRSPEQLADALASEGANLGQLKSLVGDAVAAELAGVRDRYFETLGRRGGSWLALMEQEGAWKARNNAEETMRMVRDVVGLGGL
jgi:tryptophanyl-tRNA synthetase